MSDIHEHTRTPADLEEMVDELVRSQAADNTRSSYAADIADFRRFCHAYGAEAVPASPATLAAYIAARVGVHRVSTIHRRVSGIVSAHHAAGLASPAAHPRVREALQGLRRKHGEPAHKKRAATAEILGRMLEDLTDDGTPAGALRLARDRAVLLVGYAGAFRRSELARLRVQDLSFEPAGVRVHVIGSKTDKRRQGRAVGISLWPGRYCPVRALRAWLEVSRIDEGPVFRSVLNSGALRASAITGRAIGDVWKRAAAAAGMNPEDFAGHSARSGHITEAYVRGVPEEQIMRTTGHRTIKIMRGYEQQANAFRCSASAVNL